MSEMSFASLKSMYEWKPIRNCPGRFVLQGGISSIAPEVFGGAPPRVFNNTPLPDPVVVIPVMGGGIISYQKSANTYIHTLCDAEGFERKLNSMGVVFEFEPIQR